MDKPTNHIASPDRSRKQATSNISKQSPSPLHHTFCLGHARFTAQPLSALVYTLQERIIILICTGRKVLRSLLKEGGQRYLGCQHDSRDHRFVVLL